MTTVADLVAAPHLKGRRIDLSWTNPPAESLGDGAMLSGIGIVRRERTFPLSVGDGVVVYPPGGPPGQAGPVISSFSDKGTLDHPLKPLAVYYYTVFIFVRTSTGVVGSAPWGRAACLATDDYSITDKLYRMLPAVHQRADAPLGPAELAQLTPDVLAALQRLPPNLRNQGQLYRFFNALGAPLDLARSFAEGLRQIQDADLTRPEYLRPMAASLDWKLDLTLPVFAQRNEIKFAPRLYRSVGTIPSLREIVNRYSGWYVQVAEFAQNIARANDPARLGIYSLAADGTAWRATDDASSSLGFGPGNDSAAGTPAPMSAQLTGSVPGPFALRPGMDFTVTADDRVPAVVRFRPADFVNIGAATADEMAAVLNRCFTELTASVSVANQRLVLTSNTTGSNSSLLVVHASASLVSLEAAPSGRLSLVAPGADTLARLRLFYEELDPLAPIRALGAARQVRGLPFPVGEILGAEAEPAPPGTLLSTALGADLAAGVVCTALPVVSVPVQVPAGSFLRLAFGMHVRTLFTGAVVEPSHGPTNIPVSPFTPEFGYPATSTVTAYAGAMAPSGDPSQPAPPDPQLPFETTLSSALVTGTAYTAIQVAAAPVPIHTGAFLRLVSGTHVRTVYAAADVPATVGPATLPVDPFTAESSYPTTSTLTGGAPRGTVRFKTYYAGRWGSSLALDPTRSVSQGEPAAAELGDGRILLAWLESPHTDFARLRFALGTPAQPAPAVITGSRSSPFGPLDGTELVLHGAWPDPVGFHFVASDFAQPDAPTAAEVVRAMNNRLQFVTATARPNGTVQLSTVTKGDAASLGLDLPASSAAAALGFNAGNCVAVGDSGDGLAWSLPDDVPGVPPGRLADLSALAAGGGVHIFWAAHDGVSWNVLSATWTAGVWAAPSSVISGPPGHREPAAVADAAGNIWTFLSELEPGSAADDVWTLHYRVLRPAGWDPLPLGVLTTRPGARVTDREPAPVLLGQGLIRVLFSSDRGGGKHLWYSDLNPPDAAVSAPVQVTAGPPGDAWPAPVGGRVDLRLLYRSDRSVPTSLLAHQDIQPAESRVTFPPPPAPSGVGGAYSVRLQDTGTLLKPAGSPTFRLGDTARAGRRREWDDLITYTPQKPLGDQPTDPLLDDDLFTRGTVGLYLSPLIPESPGSQQMIQRLRSVLDRFLPVNVRAVVILAPRIDIEYLYGSRDHPDILESYQDSYPYAEHYTGLAESYAVSLPDWSLLMSNTVGDVSANPGDLRTLRHRVWYLPLL